MTLLTFGLEGDTLPRHAGERELFQRRPGDVPRDRGTGMCGGCGPAFQGRPLPAQLVTPHAVLTAETLSQYYTKTAAGGSSTWRWRSSNFTSR